MLEARKNGQFVVPGEKLGVIEEFIPDVGTYVENGVIYSKNIGYVLIDFANKKISVYMVAHNQNVPKVGSIVVGDAVNVQSSTATIRMMKIGKKFTASSLTGMVHISDVNFKYTENMIDAIKLGDLVRAKVISDKNRIYHLSTRGENLGVIHASCSKCGTLLTLKDQRLQCDRCGNVEHRKIAPDYGTEVL